jgi:uncharacterized membrane protein YhhN
VIALSIVCMLACAVALGAELRGAHRTRLVAKLVASSAFVAVGALALRRAGDAPGPLALGHAIVAGLVLGAIGDACLAMPGKRWFLVGLLAFLLGHLAYVVGIAEIEPWQRWLGDAGWLAAAPIATGLGALAVLWPRLGRLRLPVIAYVVTITVMVIAAVAAGRAAPLPAANRCRLVAGAGAFFLSDLAVARERFLVHSVTNRLLGLPAYYAGQLLLAWSIATS